MYVFTLSNFDLFHHLSFSRRQGYASDTFSLSLAAIHLFTGEAPYEEIMEEVRPSPSGKAALQKCARD